MVEAIKAAPAYVSGANPAIRDRSSQFSIALQQQFSDSPANTDGVNKKETEAERRARIFKDLQERAEKYGLIINNKAEQKINPKRIVFVLGGPAEEDAQRKNYKFDKPEVGDKDGVPISITIPPGSLYAKADSYMNEVQAAYLKNNRFKSIFVDSHGGPAGWIGTLDWPQDSEEPNFFLEYNIFRTMTPDRVAEHAPFYLHTEYLRFSGCEIFGKLSPLQVGYLRNLASGYNVRIEANTTNGWRVWSRDPDGNMPSFPGWPQSGPGGNAFAFLPDRSIVRIIRPDDDTSLMGTDAADIDTVELFEAWKASGGRVIDQRKAPYQLSFLGITLTHH